MHGYGSCSELVSVSRSCRRAAMVLIRQDHFIQVAGDRDLIIVKIAQPGALTAKSIGQQRKNLAQGHRNRILAVLGLVQSGASVGLRSVIHPQLGSSHKTYPFV